tara:strand:+ start:2182 stop:2283 length:102 start_codon:yes stop_codon:yes gene_type:complete
MNSQLIKRASNIFITRSSIETTFGGERGESKRG